MIGQEIDTAHWNCNKDTSRNGLKGIYCRTRGPLPCADREYAAVNEDNVCVAYIKYETIGNQWRYAQKRFGDQLQNAIGDRMGF